MLAFQLNNSILSWLSNVYSVQSLSVLLSFGNVTTSDEHFLGNFHIQVLALHYYQAPGTRKWTKQNKPFCKNRIGNEQPSKNVGEVRVSLPFCTAQTLKAFAYRVFVLGAFFKSRKKDIMHGPLHTDSHAFYHLIHCKKLQNVTKCLSPLELPM